MQMSFKPMLTAPSYSDLYFIHISRGGKNPCIMINGGPSVLPNCVGFAFGRFMQILGTTPKLCRGDAGKWYGYTADGYKRGRVPQLGAVVCWAQPGKWGHVAIVERINSDGTFTASQSGYGYKRFWLSNHSSVSPSMKGYVFQGFIYNPAITNTMTVSGVEISSVSNFVQAAVSKVGNTYKCVTQQIKLSDGQAWSAAFILSIAKSFSGILNKVIPNKTGCSEFLKTGILQDMGTWHLGPYSGNSYIPKQGDIIAFRYKNTYKSKYDCDSLGIIRYVSNDTIYTVEGDTGSKNHKLSKVGLKQYNIEYKCIFGYFSPNWNIIGFSSVDLYDTISTRNDAVAREISYIKENQPCISTTDMKLSVINYTTALGAFFKGRITDGSVSLQFNNMDMQAQQVIQFFVNKGASVAMSTGIAANIQHESLYNPGAVGDNGSSFGICQWHLGRGNEMKNFVGSDWKTDLTGQLEFLYHDLMTKYKFLWDSLIFLPNTEDGARKAADIFVRKFEVPANMEYQSLIRQNTASDLWNRIVPILKRGF